MDPTEGLKWTQNDQSKHDEIKAVVLMQNAAP